jgi:mannose-1-phosphate guanylyltransferase
MIYAIILAGGAGTRFWPLSRQSEPKQFLNICSDRPMIEQTINRLHSLIKRDKIYIATNRLYHKKIKHHLKKLNVPRQNIFFEPEARNTLAPIGSLSKCIYEKDREAIIAVLPCDHHIKDVGRFLNVLKKAIIAAKDGYIITLGINPEWPETGYGYIKTNPKSLPCRQAGKIQNPNIFKVERFIEKPDLKKAKKFTKDKRYFWNGGIFIFRADIILQEIKKFLPHDFGIIAKIRDRKTLNQLWPKIRPISIDYAVMEKSKKLALIPASFGWVDLGSWQAIERFGQKDKHGNIFRGNCIDIASKNTIAWSDYRLLGTIGLDNLIIIDTKDALLVCAKDRTQDVKRLVEVLKKKKLIKQI